MINSAVNANRGPSPQFLGKVDSSVIKYVKKMEKEAGELYVANCERNGITVNPVAFRCINERCGTALDKLTEKAKLLHKDTVIKVVKNPKNKDEALYLSAENKNLLQEWEQTGAVDVFSIYRNNVRDVSDRGTGHYDDYISCFEKFVNKINPQKLDAGMVRTSISNLWNLNRVKLLKANYAESHTESTARVAKEIGYHNTTFADSLRAHFSEVREQIAPKSQQKQKVSLIDRIRNFFGVQ